MKEPVLDDCQNKYLIDDIVGASTCAAFRNHNHSSKLTGRDARCLRCDVDQFDVRALMFVESKELLGTLAFCVFAGKHRS